jgi:hypothetical protein
MWSAPFCHLKVTPSYLCINCTIYQGVGARSPYRCNYKVGASKDGHIKSLELNILNNHVSSLD